METTTNAPQESTHETTQHNGQPNYYINFLFESIQKHPLNRVLRTSPNEFGNLPDETPVFTKTVKWSPDGLCLLSNSEDNLMRLFEIPQTLLTNQQKPFTDPWQKCLSVSEPCTIYDFSWYPFMTSTDPNTCCFLTTSLSQPVHMWDAFTGKLRQAYTCYNQYDEVASPLSVTFNATADKIYCGLNNSIKCFDTMRPGGESSEVACVEKVEKRSSANKKLKSKLVGHTGIISCLAFNKQMVGMYAAGSYNKSVGIYDEDQNSLQHLLDSKHKGGVTHVCFSDNGNMLFSGGRKDDFVMCYDVRNLYEPLFVMSFERKVSTNQKIVFDVDPTSRYLMTGCDDGRVKVFDLSGDGSCSFELDSSITNTKDTINSTLFHPKYPYVALSSGQRKYPLLNGEGSDMEEDSDGEESMDPCWISVFEASFEYREYDEQ
ncbi:telomerase Cajal body protein [Acrasis kona]|uniref:Telomerase Cajal body protein n=1 Tax=Acrasis kona TaxID=1008807 RepID=A0AAW2ZJD2_9EUKA